MITNWISSGQTRHFNFCLFHYFMTSYTQNNESINWSWNITHAALLSIYFTTSVRKNHHSAQDCVSSHLTNYNNCRLLLNAAFFGLSIRCGSVLSTVFDADLVRPRGALWRGCLCKQGHVNSVISTAETLKKLEGPRTHQPTRFHLHQHTDRRSGSLKQRDQRLPVYGSNWGRQIL